MKIPMREKYVPQMMGSEAAARIRMLEQRVAALEDLTAKMREIIADMHERLDMVAKHAQS